MATDRDYISIANEYIDGVIKGKIPACKWIKAACKRQRKDLSRKRWQYIFDETRAAHICKFVELLPHVKGKWARSEPGKKESPRIRLEPWQVFILTSAFGWIDKSGNRRFRTAYIEVPRKNAKSTLSAGVALYGLAADNEQGAEVYSAATTADQARIVFDAANTMAKKTPGLQKRFGVETSMHSVYVPGTSSFFKPLSSEYKTLDGLNIHVAIVDELHAHRTREVYDVLETATGARTQSLLWLITTAGSDRSGICYEQRTYLTKILDGVHDDDTYFGVIYTIDDGDDWTDPAIWEKANPNYGVSVHPDDIARKCRKAAEMPAAQNNFLTKHLNQWVNADTAWMSMPHWDRCRADVKLKDFAGRRCWIGLDLASKVDIAALVMLFEDEGKYTGFGKYYLPEETIESSANSQYSGWQRSGLLTATPGNVIDFDYIEDDLKAMASRYEIVAVAYDPYQATQFATRMMAEGMPMVEVRATVLNFSEPMKNLEALVMAGKFQHDGDPVMTWMISNVVGHYDNKDNIYPKKERPENKIDGVVAMIMALGRAMAEKDTTTVYESRGVVTL